MINREDMLELSRRMTPARASVARIAGAYFDEEGYVDGTFNTHFLKLSAAERSRNLNQAKTLLLAKTNEELKEYPIPAAERKPGSIWQLLDGILESELKNDAFLDILYEVISEKYQPGYSLRVLFYISDSTMCRSRAVIRNGWKDRKKSILICYVHLVRWKASMSRENQQRDSCIRRLKREVGIASI